MEISDGYLPPVKYVVSLYSNLSETYYSFGPFSREEYLEFDKNLAKIDPNCELWSSINVAILNEPELFGTGMELAI